MNEKWALVLSGGGAKGSYQIGVWQSLIENNIKIEAIFGSSVGALNGGLIIQNKFKETVELWENLTINNIVSIPQEFIVDNKFTINKNNISKIKQLKDTFFSDNGINISPLIELVNKLTDEQSIRRSNIDFGIVTFRLNDFKPEVAFIEDIPDGQLSKYLLASATLPGFKLTKINNKYYIDGGLHDNIPFSIAKERGYRNIIVVDISGLGINKKPDVVGTNTIYIKNSSDTGTIFDFFPQMCKRNILMGYLDSQKLFNKIDGIYYFYKKDQKIYDILFNIFIKKEIYHKYKNFLLNKIDYEPHKIIKELRNILPDEFLYYKEFIYVFIELTALSLNIEKVKYYQLEELLLLINKKFNEIETNYSTGKNKNIFEKIFENLINEKQILNKSLIEYEQLIQYLFNTDNKIINNNLKLINNLFPNLIPAKIFYYIIKEYFNK